MKVRRDFPPLKDLLEANRMEELIEVRCLKCNKVYMAEYDYNEGKMYVGCPACGSDDYEILRR